MSKFVSHAVLLGFLVPTILATPTCSSSQINNVNVPGARILSLSAKEGILPAPLDSKYCNVTVVYTHPGTNDNILVQVLLPAKDWNQKFVATGGGGWSTGIFDLAYAPLSKGYATAVTDGGHSRGGYDSAASWAQVSPGNVNLYLLQDFASIALNDLSIIGKAVTASFYSAAPKKSYFDGCSMGGRQGLMLAQRYPASFDGIIAAAPAINTVKFAVANLWPQVVMKELGVYPSACELDAITAAAVKDCDDQDGATDGIISNLRRCKFNPHSLVGKSITCPSERKIRISSGAAEVAKQSWAGAASPSGKFLWYGFPYGSSLISNARSTCSDDNTENCTGLHFPISADYIQYFVTKNPSYDLSKIGYEEFARLFHISVQEFTSIIATDDPDLSEFRKAGGKMITWHGLDDDIISPYGSSDYYERVEKLDRDVRSFYRYFEVPGAGHCSPGKGGAPGEALDALVKWVEGGTAPNVLTTVTQSGEKSRDACQYPLISVFSGKGKEGKYGCKKP